MPEGTSSGHWEDVTVDMSNGDKTRKALARALRRALYHLYNPLELRKSPLTALLAPDEQSQPALALQQLLTRAIEALKPANVVPSHADAWRIYQILTYRFVEQLSQKEVAGDLALSVRQLRRQEERAIKALADVLWHQHNLGEKETNVLTTALISPAADTAKSEAKVERPPSRENEVAWLGECLPSETVDLGEMLQIALQTIAPLSQEYKVRIGYAAPENTPLVSGQVGVMRQAILNLLSAALYTAPGGQVQITLERNHNYARMLVEAKGKGIAFSQSDAPLNTVVAETLEMTRQFTRLFGGTVTWSLDPNPEQLFAATLVLPTAEAGLVLVIDDNADTLRLFQRYLTGTHYRFAGTRESERVVELAQKLAPQVIVMDVMLPGVDGWELLGRLREHPHLRAVPVIVCTILPQEQLALLLGAAAFIRKPVSRERFLTAIEKQTTEYMKATL
jgi:CheY-like chemotaxis protein